MSRTNLNTRRTTRSMRSSLLGIQYAKKIDLKIGREIDIDLNKSNSLLIVKPDPFKMQFTPRSAEKRKAMIEQWKVAEKANLQERATFLKMAQKARSG